MVQNQPHANNLGCPLSKNPTQKGFWSGSGSSSVCLANVRAWVQTPVPPKKGKKEAKCCLESEPWEAMKKNVEKKKNLSKYLKQQWSCSMTQTKDIFQ
jgi:hypothetical protein